MRDAIAHPPPAALFVAAPPLIRFFQNLIARLGAASPLRLLSLGYAFYILVSWLLLSLPICWQNGGISSLDNLFTATSGVSTTGLATVNPPVAYSFFGQLVIVLSIQVGGIGYMTLGSFVILARKKPLPEIRERVGTIAFSLPEGFSLATFLRHVILFTATIEILGAIALFIAFGSAGVEEPLWHAIFHSISAFCTAGFSTFPNSLESFYDNFWINFIITALSSAGAVGFLVFSDVWQWISGQRERITFTTQIILYMTTWTILAGWALLFLTEPSLREMPVEDRLLVSGFQSMTAVTTVGFNTVSIGIVGMAPVLLLIVLMIIGASPSGTGGGLKSTSISAALAVLWSTLRGHTRITFLGRQIPNHRLFTAYSALVFYILTLLTGTLFLLLVQQGHLENLLFEVASALGTVGLSRGLTPELNVVGKMIIIVMMFVGRVGPLTFGLSLFSGSAQLSESATEDVAI